MNWDTIKKWFTSFDAFKAVILAIVVIVSSWYDLRAEVREAKATAASVRTELSIAASSHEKEDLREHSAQEARDKVQDARADDLRTEIRDALKDLKAEIRLYRK